VSEHRGAMLLSHPIHHGEVLDWSEMEVLWRHCYGEVLGGGNPRASESRPLLLTTPPTATPTSRAATAEVLFESLRVPSLHLPPTSTLALYATGRTTGLVLECGEGVSAATPVYEGFALPHACVRGGYGGGEVTGELALLLRRGGCSLATGAEREGVRGLKEAACYVALDPPAAEASLVAAGGGGGGGGGRRHGGGGGGSSFSASAAPSSSGSSTATTPPTTSQHTLPDGTVLELGPELFRAPECLFNPARVGLEDPGVGAAVVGAVAKCDMDVRRALLGGIVCAGGSTAMRGFPQRLLREVRAAAPPGAKVAVWAPSERKVLTWVGGSILASLSTFRDLAVTREEWEEEGPNALIRRGGI
jgi:centractin